MFEYHYSYRLKLSKIQNMFNHFFRGKLIVSLQKRSINKRQIMLGIFFTSFLIVTTDSSMSIVLSQIINDLVGDSSLLFSLIGTMVFTGNLVMIYPLTKLSDRIGRKKTFIISHSIVVLGTFLMVFASQYWMILVLRFVLGLASTAGVLSALVIDHFPEEERGKPLSMFSLGLVAGYLVGSLLGGPIYNIFSDPKFSFLIIGIFPILSVASIIVNLEDAPKAEHSDKLEEMNISMKVSLKFVKSNKGLIGTLILNFFNLVIISGSGAYAITMIFTHFEQSGIVGGLYLLPVQIVEIIMFILLSRIKNFDKLFKMLIGLIFILIGFAITFAFGIDDLRVFSISIAFFGISITSLMQSADAISHKLIPNEHKSNLASIYRFVGIAGNIIGPVLFGAITDYVWIYSPGLFVIIALIISELLYWKWISKAQNIKLEHEI